MFFHITRSILAANGIEIRGRRKFLIRTEEALSLLDQSSQSQFVSRYIAIIRQGRRSGMKAWLEKPTFVVGAATWKHSALWYAGAIAHDAFHAKLYTDARRNLANEEPDADTWTGAEAEKRCLGFQRRTLMEL